MLTLTRTNHTNKHFIEIVKQLDTELAIRDGEEHDFYHQYNGIDGMNEVVVAFEDSTPVGCGAIKAFDDQAMEVKRMYTSPEHRGKGIASIVLAELEKWAHELNYKKCILETGINQPEAIALYEKNGYQRIPNYGQYANAENSRCFEKELKQPQP